VPIPPEKSAALPGVIGSPSVDDRADCRDQPVAEATTSPAARSPVSERGGPSGPEPTRYGDWERGGRCIDF
jgi:hypothetical protein